MNESNAGIMVVTISACFLLLAVPAASAGDAFEPCTVRGRTEPGAWVVSNCGQVAQADEKGRCCGKIGECAK